MGHEIETTDNVVVVGEKAWHGLGEVIDETKGAVEAAKDHGFVWPVDQLGLTASDDETRLAYKKLKEALWGEPYDLLEAQAAFTIYDEGCVDIESHVANVRVDNIDGKDLRSVLGIVSKGYSVCQNLELAEFCDALAQTGEVEIETIGSIQGGKKVWFLCRGESFDIGGVDKVTKYILASNSHDGTNAIRLTPTNIRAVCSNTLHAVIPRMEDGIMRLGDSALAIRHTGKIMDKLTEAKEAIKHYRNAQDRTREIMETMNSAQLSQDRAEIAFSEFYVNEFRYAEAEQLNSTGFGKKIAEGRYKKQKKAVDAFMSRYNREKLKLGLTDSKWLLFNGISGWIQHDHRSAPKRIERRIDSNLFGLNQARTRRALDMVQSIST